MNIPTLSQAARKVGVKGMRRVTHSSSPKQEKKISITSLPRLAEAHPVGTRKRKMRQRWGSNRQTEPPRGEREGTAYRKGAFYRKRKEGKAVESGGGLTSICYKGAPSTFYQRTAWPKRILKRRGTRRPELKRNLRLKRRAKLLQKGEGGEGIKLRRQGRQGPTKRGELLFKRGAEGEEEALTDDPRRSHLAQAH